MKRREFIALVGGAAAWPLAALTSCVKAARAEELAIPTGEPKMVMEGQTATPQGGRVVLYSRRATANYPLATYAFSRGLRGDDRTVGNKRRVGSLAMYSAKCFSRPAGGFAAWHGPGSAGMDGGSPGAKDRFRVGLVGNADHRILDLAMWPSKT